MAMTIYECWFHHWLYRQECKLLFGCFYLSAELKNHFPNFKDYENKCIWSEHVLRNIHHCTVQVRHSWITFFYQKMMQHNFLSEWRFFGSFTYMMPIVYFGHRTGDHYCTNNLSSLHISSHHCTFYASLHLKARPAFDDMEVLEFADINGDE